MKIGDILKSKRTLSFEFYPPKTLDRIQSVYRAIERLKAFNPDFVSVTYGAGGSTRALTTEIVIRVRTDTQLLPMAHITCVGQTKGEIHDVLDRLATAGIDNVIALRGDPPEGDAQFVPPVGGFSHSTDLIEYIGRNFDFGIAAACYPEGHTESLNVSTDLEHTKRKQDVGAHFLISQLFYDNTYFFDFVEKARKIGINVPILAGVLPILTTAQIRRFTNLCGATIPDDLNRQLQQYADDDDSVRELGIELATEQVEELWNNGVQGIHFYALNRSYSISRILENLDFLEPRHRPQNG